MLVWWNTPHPHCKWLARASSLRSNATHPDKIRFTPGTDLCREPLCSLCCSATRPVFTARLCFPLGCDQFLLVHRAFTQITAAGGGLFSVFFQLLGVWPLLGSGLPGHVGTFLRHVAHSSSIQVRHRRIIVVNNWCFMTPVHSSIRALCRNACKRNTKIRKRPSKTKNMISPLSIQALKLESTIYWLVNECFVQKNCASTKSFKKILFVYSTERINLNQQRCCDMAN